MIICVARLTDVPNVEPPTPSDWQPRPVYPVHHIPYHIAQYWDRGLQQQVEDKSAASHKKKSAASGRGKVPRDLRDTVKKAPGMKGWVRTLEEPVRQFLVDRGEAREAEMQKSESDFSDDEVVFVGRKGVSRDPGWKKAHREVHERAVDRGMIFDSLEDDESGSFKYVILCLLCSQKTDLRLMSGTGAGSPIRYLTTTAWIHGL